MKNILTVLAVLALALPSFAQEAAQWASGLRFKGVNRGGTAVPGQLIKFDKGALLGLKGGWTLARDFRQTGRPSVGAESRRGTPAGEGKLNQKGGFRSYDLGNQRQQIGGFQGRDVIRQRSQYFGRATRDWRSITAHVRNNDSYVRESLLYHFAWVGGSFGLPVKDAVAKDSWYLRMACTPKVKKESENRYTAQVACHGRLGFSQQQLPVVVQFTLLGSERNWKIQGQPTIVSANRLVRPGQSVMADVWAEESSPAAVEATEAPVNQ